MGYGQLAVGDGQPDRGPLGDLAGDQGAADARLHLPSDEAAQRAGAVHRVIALAGDEAQCVLADLQANVALGQPGPGGGGRGGERTT